MPHIEIVPPQNAEGELADIYNELRSSRGKIAEVHQIQSLNPRTIRTHMELYMSVMFAASPLSRAEREMMAVVVSVQNSCEYCRVHHAEALAHYWRDEPRLQGLCKDPASADLTPRELALCRYAAQVTRDPALGADGSAVALLRELDLSDREVLDATLVTAYFNFVNRVVLSLGVELEEDAGGYNY